MPSSSAISSTLRLFSSTTKLPHLHPKRSPLLLSFKVPSLLQLSSPISFQRLPIPIPIPIPIRAQQNPQSSPSPASLDLSLLPSKLQEIISLFHSVPDSKSKYQQLLHYASLLPPLDPSFKTDAHKVRGCVSQVWLRAFPDPFDPSLVRFEADSDAQLTKGLAALLVLGLSGSTPSVICRVPPEFVQLLGLQQSLTPSRNNGFLNMLKLMQEKAMEIENDSTTSGVSDEDKAGNLEDKGGILEHKKDGILAGNSVVESLSRVNGLGGSAKFDVLETEDTSFDTRVGDLDAVDAVPSSLSCGRGMRIRERLQKELAPVELEVEDISYQHAGHAGVRGNTGGETHFNVKVVSKEFEGKSLVKRHRIVYDLLREELDSGLHALSIVAKTPSEIQAS